MRLEVERPNDEPDPVPPVGHTSDTPPLDPDLFDEEEEEEEEEEFEPLDDEFEEDELSEEVDNV